MAPAAVPGIKARLFEKGSQGRLLRFCICWLVLPFLFFSLSKGKLLTYILPCFPPFAVLMAFGFLHVLGNKTRNRLFQGGLVVSAVLFGLILVAFLYLQIFGFHGFRPFHQPWKAMMVVNGFVCFLLFLFWAFRREKGADQALLLGMAPLLFFFVVHYTIPEVTLEVKSPGPILEKYRQGIADDDVIISDEDSIRAVCWYLRRSDVWVWIGLSGCA